MRDACKRFILPIAAVVGGLLLIGTGPVQAAASKQPAVTGLDSIHEKRREGGKLCFSSHEHYGEGTLPSRKGAEAAASRNWAVFTADEYGSAWGSYKLAVSKAMKCAPSGGLWTCSVTARPCRVGR